MAVKRVKRRKRAVYTAPTWLKWMKLLCVLYLVFLFLHGFFGERGFIRGYHIHREISRVRADIERLEQDNRRMEAVIKDVESHPVVMERKAREELGLARPDELVYVFVPSK